MSDYGVTKDGFARKRYDVIYEEMQTDIENATGIDISINPQSYINVLISSIADRLTALHELAEAVYYAHYPSTAEGDNLDYAVQFGGISREEAAPTKYYVLCTGSDGTIIAKNSRIASTTTPVVYFKASTISYISRSSFNKASICFVEGTEDEVTTNGRAYAVIIDGVTYLYEYGTESTTSDDDDSDEIEATDEENAAAMLTILNGLKDVIDAAGIDYTVSVDEENYYLVIESNNAYTNYVFDTNEYLTSASVSSIVVFESEELKEIKLAANTITTILTPISGWESCTNLAIYISGNERETDAELRMSYIAKQGYRSATMLTSITSAIMANVDDVISAYGFENDTDEYDGGYDDDGNGLGRPPHSIEIVVDGGDASEIAQQILYYKAAGIQTCTTSGNYEEVDVPTEYNSTVKVIFSRPATLNVWLLVTLYQNPDEAMPNNYEDLINTAIIDYTDELVGGENIVLQKMISSILAAVSGIAYLNIKCYYTTDTTETLSEDDYATLCTERYVQVTELQKASFSTDRISIVIDGEDESEETDSEG